MRQTRPDQTRPEPFFYLTRAYGRIQSFIDLTLANARARKNRSARVKTAGADAPRPSYCCEFDKEATR